MILVLILAFVFLNNSDDSSSDEESEQNIDEVTGGSETQYSSLESDEDVFNQIDDALDNI